MTEFEVAEITAANLDVMATFMSNYATHLGIYLSLLFGYCAAAFVAGSKLSIFQVVLASIMFVAAAEMQVNAMVNWVSGAQEILITTSQINPDVTPGGVNIWGRAIGVIIWQIGIFGCLSFMWSVRHQEKK